MRGQQSLLLTTTARALFHAIMAFSLYLLLAGHNAPGGGFAGGLVAGIALVLRYVEGTDPPYQPDGGAGDVDDQETRSVPVPRPEPRLRVQPGWLLGCGLLLAVLTGAASWLTGEPFLTSGKLALHLPVLGTVKATSALAFDTGVYLLVVGLVLALLRTLGREEAAEREAEDAAGTTSGAGASGAPSEGTASGAPSAPAGERVP